MKSYPSLSSIIIILTKIYTAALYSITQLLANALAGSDYIARLEDVTSRNFTVTFLSKQANSTEYAINIADDAIFEGREYFRLRISAVRPIGQAAQLFVLQPRENNTFVDISIEDDDSK